VNKLITSNGKKLEKYPNLESKAKRKHQTKSNVIRPKELRRTEKLLVPSERNTPGRSEVNITQNECLHSSLIEPNNFPTNSGEWLTAQNADEFCKVIIDDVQKQVTTSNMKFFLR
jgi:hypothetical protein